MAPATSRRIAPGAPESGNRQNRTAPNDSLRNVFIRLLKVVSRLYRHRSSEPIVSDHHHRLLAVEFNHYGCPAGPPW